MLLPRSSGDQAERHNFESAAPYEPSVRFAPPFSLLLFHSRSGARIALRRLSVPLAVLGGVGHFLDEGLWPRVAQLAFGPHAGLAALAGVGLPLLLLFLAAREAAPRLRVGDAGWLRHLPASRAHHRLARTLGVAFAVSPLAMALAALAALERRGLPLLASWLTLSTCVLVAAATFAVSDRSRRRTPSSRSRPAPNASFRFDLEARITCRAVGPWGSLPALAAALPILAIAWLFATNNELLPIHEARGALLAAGVAATTAMAMLAERLAARRPIWGWARSLPRAAASRVRMDALGFALVGMPIAAAVSILVPPSPSRTLAAFAALGLIPPLATIAAAAVRGAPEARIGPSGEIFTIGLLATALVALVPALALAFLLATPAGVAWAAARERNARPSRFGALRHLEDGDPYALGDSR